LGRTPLRRRLFPLLVIAPGLVFYGIFTVYPILDQVQISFLHWNLVPGRVSPFVGLANYVATFHDPAFLTAIRNTILYMGVTVPAQMAFGMGAAILLRSKLPALGLWRTLIYIPVIASWVVVTYVFSYIFSTTDGVANALLMGLFGPHAGIAWLASTWPAMGVLWLLAVWKGVGWSMVIFLAALAGVPSDQVEAARVDGAPSWQRFWHVTLPSIRPAAVFVLVMLVIGGVQAFTSIFLLTGGAPDNTTQVVLTYAYQQAFDFFNFSYGAAMATMVGIALLVLSIVMLRELRERG